MPFEPNNNLGGRKKGSNNQSTEQIKGMFKLLLENNLDDIQVCLNCMKAPERFNAIIQLAKFVIPTMKATDITIEGGFTPIQIILTNEDSEDDPN